jgi:hypothetical protein
MVGRKRGLCCKLSLLFSWLSYLFCYSRFLYTLYIAIDGNFKLKGKERGLQDVELMPGWGAYVPEAEYKSHIANYVDQPEVRVLTFAK